MSQDDRRHEMKSVGVAELRTRPREVWKTLREEGELVLTMNGKPMAVLAGVSEETLEQTLRGLRRLRFQAVLAAAHSHSVSKGLDKMSDEEIEAEIAAARKSARARSRR